MNSQIVIGLINNAALLLALGLIYDILYCGKRSAGAILHLVISGLIIGGMAVMLMVSPVTWESGIIFDTRTILLGLTSLFFGAVPAVIAMAIAAGYRLYLGGNGVIVGVATIVTSGLVGLAWRRFRFRRSGEMSFAELYLLGIVIHGIMILCMAILPPELFRRFLNNLALPVIIIYPVVSALLGKLLVNRQKRHLIEEDLHNSKEQFKAIANFAASWEAWFDPTGKLKWMNPYSVKLTGYTPEEYLAADDFLAMAIAAEDRAKTQDRFQQALTGSSGDNLEIRFLRKDGTQFWGSVSWQPIFDAQGRSLGFRTSAQDITERKHSEETIRQSEEKFSAAFYTTPLMTTITRLDDWIYLDVNRKFCELTGYSRDETIGKTALSLGIMTTEDRQRLMQEVQKNNFIAGIELKLTTKDGKSIIAVFYGELISLDNDLCLLAIALDVTEHRHLEEQLRHAQKMEAVGQLAGGVAHDFNNILSVIMGYSYILKNGMLDASQQEKLGQIIAAAERASQLTSGLLAFSRKQVLAPKTVNLNDIVQHLQTFLLRVIGEDVHLKSILNEVDLPVSVDSGQIEQVLINLATNARDAMPKGGQLTIETGLHDIDAAFVHAHNYGQVGQYAVITVTDTGSGIDAETRKKIFEPFFTTKEPGKGTGLGMAIVYGIVKQHDGFINLYSEPGKGTTFRIYLPIVTRDAFMQEEQATPAPPAGGNETILVAEDEPVVRTLVESILTGYGYNVILAADGKEAVEQFMTNRDAVQLILMDMIMPQQSGMVAAEEIRRLKPAQKILFSSGYTADFIRNRGVDEEGVELIMKPYQPLELLRKIREILQ